MGPFRGALGARVEAEVASGRPLAEALALFPDEVPREDVAILEAGEATGNLDRVLDRLADRHDARASARRGFLTEAWYPLLLFHLAALITPIVPSLRSDGHLFGPSWFAGALSVLVPFYALLGLYRWMRSTARGRDVIRRVVDVVPGFGHAARRHRHAEFADVLGVAYDAGVRLDRATELAGAVVGDARLDAAAAAVGRGSTLLDALAATGFLPSALLSRIAVGEKAGELGKVLAEIARTEAEAAEHALRRSTMLTAKLCYLAVALWIASYALTMLVSVYRV